MNTNKKGIILLSGGLDSLACLDIALKKDINIELALTFNYGQKAFKDENEASLNITKYYNIEHKVIDIPFLKEINKNALTDDNNNDFNNLKNVWITNRNGLFLNIAACFADKFNYNYIILGANKEEGREFPDNTKDFIKAADTFFEYSTSFKPKVFAPCLEMDKIEIINYAIENNLPLNYLKSCYDKSSNNKKHCGKCMSCKLLYNAIINSKKPELLGEIF